MRTLIRTLAVLVIALPAWAGGLDGLTNSQATSGLREALDQGARAAVSQLGQSGGFLNNPKVLEKAKPILSMLGRGKDMDKLETAMNQAAEAAVPEAKTLLVDAVKQMSVDDAKNILTGGEDSVTRYFESKTREALTGRFMPVVTEQTNRLSLAKQYNKLADKASATGLLEGDEASVEQYVTAKALDGLYLTIAEQERAIRQNPLQAAGSLAKQVFGALGR